MVKNHLGLLCDIGELNALFAGSDNIDTFLQQIVDLVAKHIQADVCSIYIYDEKNKELVLKANRGLNPKSVNKTKLKLGEGLVGVAVKEMRPICETSASKNPNFKVIPGMNEEAYESFLVVPILRGIEYIGALVVQREKNNAFNNFDIMALKAITSQLAGVIENTRILINVHSKDKRGDTASVDNSPSFKFIKAQVASEGVALATAVVIDKSRPYRLLNEFECKKKYTSKDFSRAVEKTEKQLDELQKHVEEKLTGVASLIFEAHILMLKDTAFTGAMAKRIARGENPLDAILFVADEYIQKFSQSTNSYIREKANDVEDLARRLFGNVLAKDTSIVTGWKNRIIIAGELYPSDILKLSSEEVCGIILVSGGVTSHLSILARSLQIPLVIVNNDELLNVSENTVFLLDAEVGIIYIDPSKEVISRFEERQKTRVSNRSLKIKVKKQTNSRDGTQVHLLSNINLMVDLKLANDLKSEGVGLYRTEFPFLLKRNFPTEEEQLIVYSTIAEQMENRPINFRTLDIGGEKVLAYYHNAQESNPALGMRSIRFSLSHKEIFHQQLRAILRAGANLRDLQITFPMISSLDEFLEAREDVSKCIDSLKAEKKPHHKNPKVGVMVETPSVVDIIDGLAAAADFFCIGTNDFIQFMLAVDRANATVSSYYIPHHPSILRSLNTIVRAALDHGKGVSICGEMAHEEIYVPFFLGIGVRTLSVDPRYLSRVQAHISKLDIKKAEEIATSALREDTIAGTASCLGIRPPPKTESTASYLQEPH